MKLSTFGKLFILLIILFTTACQPITNDIANTIEPSLDQVHVAKEPTEATTFIGNPAAYYCSEMMGYNYQIVTDEYGDEYGKCIMPTGEVCGQWDFYSGQCGAEYSYCSVNGMEIETRTDGNDPYNPTYAACINKTDRSDGIRISDLLNLETSPLEAEEPEQNREIENQITPEALSALPTSFDWRNVEGENWLSTVKDQSACGSCWAFSAIGVMEAYYNLYAMNASLDLNFAEEHLVSNCFQSGCSGGHSYTALSYIRDHGIVDETCFPYPVGAFGYENYELPCAGVCADPTYYTIPSFTYEYYDFTPEELKYYLVKYGPLSVYLSMSGDYNPITGAMECGPLTPGNINHAVVLVGYDDAGGYWIAKNSWGADYQDSGYFKVAYNNCNIDNTLYAYIPVNREDSFFPILRTSGEKVNLMAESVAPVGGITLNTLVPTFEWINDINADNYDHYLELEVSEDPIIDTYSKKNRVWNWWGEESWYPWYNLEPDTLYYWHLTYNINDGTGDYYQLPASALQTFTTGSGGVYPSAPNLTYPLDNAVSTTRNMILEWEPSTPIPQLYELYIESYDCSELWGCGYVGHMIYPTYNSGNVISFLNRYSGTNEFNWAVRALSDYAWGDYSDTWKFWISPYTTRPENLQPTNGAVVTGVIPELSWNTNNIPDPGSWVYYQISEDPLFQPWNGIFEGYAPYPEYGSIRVSDNLDENTLYYWRAAFDFYNTESGYWEIGPYSPEVSFYTGSVTFYPAEPFLVSPTNGAMGVNNPVVLNWNSVSGAEEYYIQVYFPFESEGSIYYFGYSETTPGTSLELPSGLILPSTEYFWYVRARNNEAWSDYSSTWTFTTSSSVASSSSERLAQLDSLAIQIDDQTMLPLRVLVAKSINGADIFDPAQLPDGVRMYFRSEDGEITFIEPTR